MMDVIRCQESCTSTEEQLNRIIQEIQCTSKNNISHERLKNRLKKIQEDVLGGDFGGYYSSRKPLIQKINNIWETLDNTCIHEETQDDYIISAAEYSNRNPSYTYNNTFTFRDYFSNTRNNNYNNENRISSSLTSPIVLSIEKTNTSISNDTCSICLENFDEQDDLKATYTICGHRFHDTCINVWIRSKNTCPLCKTIL